jgi:hypothetical protein
MLRLLIVTIILTINSLANTNALTKSITHDRIDLVNTDMQEKYRLPLKSDKTLFLTGYTIQDNYTKLIRTYSVFHIDL